MPFRRLVMAVALLVLAPIAAAAAEPGSSHSPVVRNDFQLTGRFTQGGWMRGEAPSGTVSLTLGGRPVTLAPDGAFFAAFDRDAPAVLELVAHRDHASDVQRSLAISPRGWQIEQVNAPFHPPGLPDADFARIRSGELARIAASRAVQSDAQGWRQAFVWPLHGAIRGRFGAQRIYRGAPGSYHAGLDIAGATGTAFTAPADGVVVLAASAPFTLEGNLLIVDHGAWLSSAFLHCSKLAVREGETVRQGQVLGWVGMTGRASGPHLHWALKWQDARLDPLLFVGE